MAELLKIANWAKHFENNRTRELKKMDWVPVPTKQDGDGYTELVSHAHGAAHLGAWIALVEIAAKCEPRGELIRSAPQEGAGSLRSGGRPHNSASLARISRLPQSVFEEAIPRLISIGWLESEVVSDTVVTTIPHEGAALGSQVAAASAAPATQHGTEGNGRERNGREGKDIEASASSSARADSASIDDVVAHYQSHHPRAKAGKKERAKIAARLREGFTVDDLRLAIDGCHVSTFHSGGNERGAKYQQLELIVRDASKTTRFIELAGEEGGPQLSEKSRRSLDALDSFVTRFAERQAEHGNT